jgi:hypothetical protein
MTKHIKWKKVLKHFNNISLEELNAKAKLLDRSEVKYVIHQEQLTKLFHELMKDFDLLAIDGKTLFTYESVYFDTPERDFYSTHNAGIKDRIKIRTRRYVDSDLHFFEFKHRHHDVIRKYRYTIDAHQHGRIDDTAKSFIEDTHQAIYGK